MKKFICDGQSFDTAEMICPQIKDKFVSAVYITKNYGNVYSACLMQDNCFAVKQIRGIALQILAERTGNSELAKAVEAEAASHQAA